MTLRRIGLVAGVLAMALAIAACGDDGGSSGGGSTTAGGDTTAGPNPDLKATLDASGATFPKAYYEEAIAEFTAANKGVTVNYGGGGSGKGRQDLADQIVDWAGSDSPVKDEDLAKFKGGDVLYFPTVVAPITVSVNLDVEGLKLSCETIAKIYQREIKTWNDPAITAENPDAKLPATAITVARRADSSGTTDNFTKFLDKGCGSGGSGVWKLKSGSTVEWPADTQAGQGNSGVAQIVKSTAGAIGYVDLSDAKAADLNFASIKNKAGAYVEPTLDGASAAAAGAKVNDNLTFSAVWADGDASYPITAQTWILVYKKQTDKATADATKAFVKYVLTDGQKLAPEVDFAPLPKELSDKALAQLSAMEMPA
ncbi:MAG TPA: phosphate ABC transporter substrate-binding protein PstS [Acidimicrobiales bacterium]